MRFADIEDRRTAVWGCGREGRAALAALATRLPDLPVTLFCQQDEAAALRRDGLPARLAVRTVAPAAGMLSRFDVVIKSPGISAYKPEILAAQSAGTVFTSGTALWFGENPAARVIGITGTKGKSTTSAMLAHLARNLGVRTALAGNIGLPLLELMGQDADLWVLELSSFQTGELGALELGVITSLYAEHLDWHGSTEHYIADKLKLADVARTLVVNATQPGLLARTATHARRVLFGGTEGWSVRDGDLYRGQTVMDPSLRSLKHLPGLSHNALNACAALSALDQMYDLDDEHGLDAVHSFADFRSLPHRLQFLGERDGLGFIDDSISTNPEATLAALRSLLPGQVSVIVGGHDRGLDWSGFVDLVVQLPNLRIVTQGGNGPRIAAALRAARMELLHEAVDLQAAVATARRITPVGGVILLSPGAPSFDQFRDYTERGCRFAELAGFDVAWIASIQGIGLA